VTDERCPRCGQVIPSDAPRGQCPTCLLNLALEADAETDSFEAADPELAETIGPYRLVRELGRGGMGLVFLAEQVAPVRRLVALKVIKPGIDSKQVLARFESERQALALLQHPGIAAIHDAGTTRDGHPFFVMEYVPGQSITRYCDVHRLAIDQRVELFLQVCAAITHAHQKGIIHRDLKPSNLLVMEQNDQPLVKVIDFGVAKAVSQRLTERTVFTQHGAIIGTPEYMSPEQAGATEFDVDTRTDIYSLGVVLYELLAGVRPFEADALRDAALVEVLRMIREVTPPRLAVRFSSVAHDTAAEIARQRQADVRSLTGQLRGDLEWITLRALEKEPARRYPSASELAGDLRRFLLDEPVFAGPPGVSYRLGKFVRRHKAAVGALLGVVVALAIGLVASLVSYARVRDSMALVQRQNYVANITAASLGLQARAFRETEARLRQVDPSRRGWEWHHLFLAADPSIGRFGDGSPVRAINFDASGSHIIWDAAESLRSVELASGREVLSKKLPGIVLGRSTDGRRAIFVKMSGLSARTPRAPTAGAPEIRDLHSGRGIAPLNAPSWFGSLALVSPDGRRIVMGDRPDGGRLALLDGDSGQEVTRLDLPEPVPPRMGIPSQRVVGFAFSGDGRRLAACLDSTLRQWDAASGRELFTSRPDSGPVASPPKDLRNTAARLQGDGGPVTLIGDMGVAARAKVSYTNHDTKVLCFDETDAFTEWDAATGRALATWRYGRPGRPLAVSADGARMAWGDRERLLITDVRTGDVQADLLGHGHDVTTAAFSPDGLRLASGALRGPARVWDTSRDRAVTTLRSDANRITRIAFHANGRELLAAAPTTLESWDLASRRVRSFAGRRSQVFAIAMTPDGGTLVSVGFDGTIQRWDPIQGRPIQGRPIQSTGEARRELWQALAVDPQGQHIAVASAKSVVLVWNVASGAMVSQLSTQNPVVCLAWSPDGNRLAAGEQPGGVIVWNTRTWQAIYRMQPQPPGIAALAFSPDSSRLAVGTGSDIRVLDASSGLERGPPLTQGNGTMSLAYSPDGLRLVSADADAAVRMWDVESHDLVLTLRHTDLVTSVAFSQDGLRLGAASANGTILIWNTLPKSERPSEMAR
jgi:eukaryotic-like serine/threonine-protein kinase